MPRARVKQRAGLLGAIVGTIAAGLATGVAAERALVRRTRRGAVDPYAEELFGQQPYDEACTVTTADGTDLYVEIVEPVDGLELDVSFAATAAGAAPGREPTIVFVHGFCLDMGTFYFQRKELTRRGDYRMVFYDQPGHGRSGKLEEGEYELPALGEALRAVLDKTVADGPAVLVGHSMGGMAIMAFAERYPEYFSAGGPNAELPDGPAKLNDGPAKVNDGPAKLTGGPNAKLTGGAARLTDRAAKLTGRANARRRGAAGRPRGRSGRPEPAAGRGAARVAGVVLMATSGGRMEQVKFGLPSIIGKVGQPLLPLVNGATRLTGGVVDRARLVSSDLAWLLTRRYGFGTTRPSPTLVSFVEQMNSHTSTETITRYLRTLYTHARYPALVALRHTPVLLICGDHDMITPMTHSQEILRHLPDAELVTIADSGHVVMLEHAADVNAALLPFLEKIT